MDNLSLAGFLTIPFATHYDDFINRSKLTQQKKRVEHKNPPPLKWVGNYRCH